MPMKEGFISLEKTLEGIDSGAPFDLVHVTFDRTRGTGGEIKERKKWTKANFNALPEVVLRKAGIKDKRNPNHSDHRTRNIYNPATREIKKIYIRLICSFNGKSVL